MTDEERSEFLFRCEVREWMRRRVKRGDAGAAWLRQVLEGIERTRGREAADRLREAIRTQWQLGNRGTAGDWREP